MRGERGAGLVDGLRRLTAGVPPLGLIDLGQADRAEQLVEVGGHRMLGAAGRAEFDVEVALDALHLAEGAPVRVGSVRHAPVLPHCPSAGGSQASSCRRTAGMRGRGWARRMQVVVESSASLTIQPASGWPSLPGAPGGPAAPVGPALSGWPSVPLLPSAPAGPGGPTGLGCPSAPGGLAGPAGPGGPVARARYRVGRDLIGGLADRAGEPPVGARVADLRGEALRLLRGGVALLLGDLLRPLDVGRTEVRVEGRADEEGDGAERDDHLRRARQAQPVPSTRPDLGHRLHGESPPGRLIMSSAACVGPARRRERR
ncbi:hypothetical protein ACQP04_02160 [Pseudonocardia halophobica]|uniref:hypothetical protein n=1 Tax=Pseudonocardia halophobica TaxID=29401 RepID=UPI003D8C68E2